LGPALPSQHLLFSYLRRGMTGKTKIAHRS
jgi:hypothetical protein